MQKKKYDLTSELVDITSEPINRIMSNIPVSKNTVYSNEKKILLTMAIEEEIKADFKAWCARNKLKMTDAFIRGFKLLKEKHGH